MAETVTVKDNWGNDVTGTVSERDALGPTKVESSSGTYTRNNFNEDYTREK